MVTAIPGLAQDSTSKSNCLPGDALSPWNTSEQRNRFVVDLVEITTSWGKKFGIAPILKSSKSNPTFFTSLISAQGISRTQRNNIALSGSYDLWTKAGAGVNNNRTLNDAGTPTSPPTRGNQFGAAFAEFGFTPGGVSHNGA